MVPKHAKHSKRTKQTEAIPPPLWDHGNGNSDLAGTPIESDLTDFKTPRTGGDEEPDTATRYGDVSTFGSIPMPPSTPTSDLADANTPKSMYKAPPTTFTTNIPAHLKQPRPVRGVSISVSDVSATAGQQPHPVRADTRNTVARDAVLSDDWVFLDVDKPDMTGHQDEDHICTAAALFVAGVLLGGLMNGFSLLLGTLLHGKRRRNYVLGCSLGAVLQILTIIIVLVYAVPMTGPAGVLFRTESS